MQRTQAPSSVASSSKSRRAEKEKEIEETGLGSVDEAVGAYERQFGGD